jgi:hypothetical protein
VPPSCAPCQARCRNPSILSEGPPQSPFLSIKQAPALRTAMECGSNTLCLPQMGQRALAGQKVCFPLTTGNLVFLVLVLSCLLLTVRHSGTACLSYSADCAFHLRLAFQQSMIFVASIFQFPPMSCSGMGPKSGVMMTTFPSSSDPDTWRTEYDSAIWSRACATSSG